MYIGIREKFNDSDDSWQKYFVFAFGVKSTFIREVRTIDHGLNPVIEEIDLSSCDKQSILFHAKSLLKKKFENCYVQLAANLSVENPVIEDLNIRLLGYDLADETLTSSLINCGPWEGNLEKYHRKLNEYGLLSLPNVKKAQCELLIEWPDDPHGDADVWALYEISIF